MILSSALASPETVQRFRREAEAAAHLIHPNIVQTFEVGEHDGQHFFSMESVDGPSLSALNRDQPLLARQAAEVVRTLAEAVQFAHTRDVIHRDLKPQNVLMQRSEIRGQKAEGTNKRHASDRCSLTSDLCPKITDFGLAKRLDTDSGQTKTGEIMGTPSDMAPEQAAGKTKAIGPPADIYALGAILYELLTGRPPFRANTPLDTLLPVLEQEPVS